MDEGVEKQIFLWWNKNHNPEAPLFSRSKMWQTEGY
jgi:hypothetical protein